MNRKGKQGKFRTYKAVADPVAIARAVPAPAVAALRHAHRLGGGAPTSSFKADELKAALSWQLLEGTPLMKRYNMSDLGRSVFNHLPSENRDGA